MYIELGCQQVFHARQQPECSFMLRQHVFGLVMFQKVGKT